MTQGASPTQALQKHYAHEYSHVNDCCRGTSLRLASLQGPFVGAVLTAGVMTGGFFLTDLGALTNGDNEPASTATARPVPPLGLQPPAQLPPAQPLTLPDRTSCVEIRGTDYRSEAERQWFIRNCSATPLPPPPSNPPPTNPQPPVSQPTARPPAAQPTARPANCHPSYPTVCIAYPLPDLDCPQIPFKRFQVVGSDPHRFDSDRDGIGCE